MKPIALSPWSAVWCGGAIVGLALGVRHVQGLFLLPLTMERGWGRDTFAFAMAVQNLVWGLSQPLLGAVADRFGSRPVIVGGLLAYALGLVGMAVASAPGLFVLAAGGCVGVALSGTSFAAVYGAISRLVPPDERSRALGLAGALGGVGQFVLVPVAQGLIDTWGPGGAFVAFAALAIVALPLARPLRDAPATADGGPGLRAAVGQALRHRGFWLLQAGFLVCGFQLAFVATHLPAYLRDHGLRPGDGVVALALIALANVFGTYAWGVLGARHPRKHLLVALYLLRSAAMAAFLMAPVSAVSTWCFATAMGLLWLGTVPLTNGLVSQIFGVRHVGTLFGGVFLGHQVGSFLGVWLGGRVFAATGSYDAIWFVAMALGVLAALLHAPIDDRAVTSPAPVPA